MRDNTIEASGKCGVRLTFGTHATITRNYIVDGHGKGVMISSRSTGTLLQNILENNKLLGVEVSGESDPLIEDNRFLKNLGPSLSVSEGGKPRIVGNHCSGACEGEGAVRVPGPSPDASVKIPPFTPGAWHQPKS